MVQISFIGDIALNGGYTKLRDLDENPFNAVLSILRESDFRVGNLECLAKGRNGENELKEPRLKTNIRTLEYLSDLNLNMVSLAHNHIYDNLLDGYLKTIKFLKERNIVSLGAGLNRKHAEEPHKCTIKKKKFCFLNYITRDTNPCLPADAELYLNWFSIDDIITDIQSNRESSDFVIVLLHWGGRVEGGNYPDLEQVNFAHKIIDSGADLIVGHHSHTLQPFELYKGKYIFYSLGNFCFSNFYSNGQYIKTDFPNRTNSMILNVIFFENDYDISYDFIRNNNLYIEKNDVLEKKYDILNRRFRYLTKYTLLWKLYYFDLKIVKRIIKYFQKKLATHKSNKQNNF